MASLLTARSWEEERISLTGQLEALRKEARLYISCKNQKGGTGNGIASEDPDASSVVVGDGEMDAMRPELQLAAVRRALDQAKENEVWTLSCWQRAWQCGSIRHGTAQYCIGTEMVWSHRTSSRASVLMRHWF